MVRKVTTLTQGVSLPRGSVDLGAAQIELEQSTKQLKKATSALNAAHIAFQEAEERHAQAKKGLNHAFGAVVGANKMPL